MLNKLTEKDLGGNHFFNYFIRFIRRKRHQKKIHIESHSEVGKQIMIKTCLLVIRCHDLKN